MYGIMEKRMETTIGVYRGSMWDDGKENGNFYLGVVKFRILLNTGQNDPSMYGVRSGCCGEQSGIFGEKVFYLCGLLWGSNQGSV